MRAGFPRHRSRARPVGQDLICDRSAGACPPRSTDLGGKRSHPRDHGRLLLRPVHGEGQALALREGAAFFPHREAYHLDVEQFMKHPQLLYQIRSVQPR